MQFFIDSQGTVVNLISSPVYQGSTNACELVLVAPFSASNIIEADFRLPNGITTEPYIMTVQGQMQIEGRTFNVWRVLLDGVVTEYAGKVTVQFRIYQGGYNVGNDYYPITPTSYASTFSVAKGVVPNLPQTPTTDVYKTILSYLSQLDPQYTVESVIYSAPGNEINTDSAIDRLETIPPNANLKWNAKLEPSNVDGSLGGYYVLYALDEELQANTGFTMTFAEPTNVGKMQITFSGIEYSVLIGVKATLEDDTEVDITDFRVRGVDAFSVLVSVNKTVKKISIIQPYNENRSYDAENYTYISNYGFTQGRFYVNSIKLWRPATNGQITLVNTALDTIASFPDADYDTFLAQAEQAREQAEQSATEAQTSAQNALNYYNQLIVQKNAPNGIAGLDANGLINASQIPSIVKHEYFEVASEDALTTLSQAEQGDIAYLLDETGTTVVNSWILLGGSYDVRANWKEQSTSTAGSSAYADQAGTALDAQAVNGLTINGILSEADYNALASKQGVYFVTITGE